MAAKMTHNMQGMIKVYHNKKKTQDKIHRTKCIPYKRHYLNILITLKAMETCNGKVKIHHLKYFLKIRLVDAEERAQTQCKIFFSVVTLRAVLGTT